MTDAEILRDISRMVREALQERVDLVIEGGEGVEYDTCLARERLRRDGVNADLRAIRVGEYFKRFTEFNLLQRLHRTIEGRISGDFFVADLSTEEDQG